MKIRTDFVTNSSSSSFSVVVAIEDKNGKTYSFEERPYEFNPDSGGTCSFNANLENILLKNAVKNIMESSDTEYLLDDDGSDEISARIENVVNGDQLSIVKTPGQTKLGWQILVDYAVEVHSKEGSLGLLPGEAVKKIKDVIDSDTVLLKATVSRKRKKKGKYSLIYVFLEAEEKKPDQVLVIEKVSKLAEFLMNSVSDDFHEIDADEMEYWEEDEIKGRNKIIDVVSKRKASFISDVSKNVSSITEIAKISVHRDYSAWGEYADLIPDNDEELCKLAERVNSTSGEEQKKALDDMLDYIRTSSPDRYGENFGYGYKDIRYAWHGDESDLIALAKRLQSGFGPDMCEGREHDEIDLVNGIVESYAEFDLC